MCNFFSALGLPDGTIKWHWMLDSHHEIVGYYGLDDTSDRAKFAKLELTPGEDWFNADTWQFKVDEEVQPFWAMDELLGQWDARMRSIVRGQTIMSGEVKMILEGFWIIGGDAQVDTVHNGRIIRVADSATFRSIYGGTFWYIYGGTIQSIYGGMIQSIYKQAIIINDNRPKAAAVGDGR